MTSTAYTLTPGSLDMTAIGRCAEGTLHVELAESAWQRIDESAAAINRILARGAPVYGINTGFGKLAQTRVSNDRLAELQLNLVRSHCTGVGPALAAKIVRLVLLLKIASLGHGVSGVRRDVVNTLLSLLNADTLPVLPALGSVGASGDLAPLAHLAAVLIGEGQARHGEHLMRGSEAMTLLGLAPLVLGPKEGLALVNGTQVSTAIALIAEMRARCVFDSALVAGAMSTDAAQGSDAPFDDRIHAVRGQVGQRAVAQRYRKLLEGSAIRASHLTCDKVQDPYCLRCQPQVMGACLDQLDHARSVLLTEANGVSDNPLIFAAADEALSGGNFHGEPVAFAADNIALAVSEIGALSERRVAMLMDASLSGLPPFLACDGGLNSGFMIAQVTAAALASENKALAHPRAVDSLPTSANQEDHVSMATGAALRLLTMVDYSARIVAIELLAAAQGIDLRRPLRSSTALEAAVAVVRRNSGFLSHDRALGIEVETLVDVLERGEFGALSLP